MKEEISVDYVKGFNHAQIIMSEKPELLDFLIKMTPNNDYFSGLKDGQTTFYKNIVISSRNTKVKEPQRHNNQ